MACCILAPIACRGSSSDTPLAAVYLGASANNASTVSLNWNDLSGVPGITAIAIYRSRDYYAQQYTLLSTEAPSATSWTDSGLLPVTTYYYYLTVSYNASGPRDVNSNIVGATTRNPVNNPPSNLAYSYLAASNSVRLTWQDNSESETGFQLEKSVDGGASFYILAAGANGTAANEANVTVGRTYYFRMRALLPGGTTTAASNTVEAPLTAGQLTAPTNLRGLMQSSTSVQLSWSDNSSNESGFEVQRAVTGTNGFTVIQTTASGATSMVDSSLLATTSYTYRVRAVAISKVSLPSNLVSVPAGTAGVLRPSNLRSSINSSNGIRLQWDDNSTNETGFEISQVYPFSSSPINVGPNTSIYDFGPSTFTPGATYGVVVRAMNGAAPASGFTPINFFASPVLPSPTNLTVSQLAGASSGTLRLAWTDNWLIESALQLETSLDGSYFVPLPLLAANTTSVTTPAVFVRRTWYRVAAVSSGGTTSYSNVVSIVPQ